MYGMYNSLIYVKYSKYNLVSKTNLCVVSFCSCIHKGRNSHKRPHMIYDMPR